MEKRVVGRMATDKTQSVVKNVKNMNKITSHSSKGNSLKHIKRLKKLNVKKGDILVITLKGYPSYEAVERVRGQFGEMPFLQGVNMIFISEQLVIRTGKPKSGKHKVELNNLEYLEYLSKQKGEE